MSSKFREFFEETQRILRWKFPSAKKSPKVVGGKAAAVVAAAEQFPALPGGGFVRQIGGILPPARYNSRLSIGKPQP